ncbi:hypothetical protein VTN96DRAFT_2775 [Rasamsonia emersonii]
MDHLPLPADPLLGHPQVEYLCDPNFRLPIDCPLLDYPAKKGLDKDAVLTTGRLGDLDAWQMKGFVQEWLFFGVLSKILEIPGILIQHTEFVTKGLLDRDILTTAALPAYLRVWAAREEQASPEDREQHALQVQAVLEDAKLIVDRLYSERSDYDPLGPGGFVHIALCETLEYAAIRIYRRVFPTSERKPKAWRRSTWPARRMRMDGWCPNRVQMLSSLLSSSAMYYASALRMDYSTMARHATCSAKRCNMHYLDKDRYRQKHVVDSCDCDLIGPPEESLASALANGHIPLVRLVMDGEKGCTIETVEADLQDPPSYVAISHVWSDGRGNVTANALPTCQLQYIQFLVSMIIENDDDKPGLFWLDTLCVPIRGEYRPVAIGRMRRTYESAAKVLVLDGELETASMRTTPVECLMRIVCSGWMRRLWTLQEGALAKELLFQFKEQALALQDLIDASQRDEAVDVPANPTVDVVSSLQYFQRFKRLESERVLELVEALQWRTTTKQEDEPVCLAVLLDLDAGRIASTAPEHRMAELLQMMKLFPAHLMFAPGRRLTQRYFRWAPSSLMPTQGFTLPPPSLLATPLAMQSPRGLIATLPGLSLPLSTAPLRDTVWFRIENDESYYRLCNFGKIEDDGPSWKDIGPHNIESPALVLAGCFCEGLGQEMGALVSIVYKDSKDSKVIVADFVSRVSIFVENGELPAEVSMESERAAAAMSSETAVLVGEAQHIPVTRWCIR